MDNQRGQAISSARPRVRGDESRNRGRARHQGGGRGQHGRHGSHDPELAGSSASHSRGTIGAGRGFSKRGVAPPRRYHGNRPHGGQGRRLYDGETVNQSEMDSNSVADRANQVELETRDVRKTTMEEESEHVVVEHATNSFTVSTYQRLIALSAEGETFDPNYQPRKRKFFGVGRVFKVLWSEPAGKSQPSEFSYQSFGSTGFEDQWTYSKIRRFVVVSGAGHGRDHVLALYNGQGATKTYISTSEHGIIHTTPDAPNRIVGEEDMSMLAIHVDREIDEKLSHESRINYGKVYTVECNIRAKGVGMVNEPYKQRLLDQFCEVWRRRFPLFNPESGPSSKSHDPSRKTCSDLLLNMAVPYGAAGLSTDQESAVLGFIDTLLDRKLVRLDVLSGLVDELSVSPSGDLSGIEKGSSDGTAVGESEVVFHDSD